MINLFICVRILTGGSSFLQGLSTNSMTQLVSRGICVSSASSVKSYLANVSNVR